MTFQLEPADIQQLADRIAAALPAAQLPKLLSIPTVAEHLDCSPDHVNNLIARGHLETINIAEDPSGQKRALRVTAQSLAKLMDSRKVVG